MITRTATYPVPSNPVANPQTRRPGRDAPLLSCLPACRRECSRPEGVGRAPQTFLRSSCKATKRSEGFLVTRATCILIP